MPTFSHTLSCVLVRARVRAMHRMLSGIFTATALAGLAALPACAKSKADDAPAPAPTEAGPLPVSTAGKPLLCTDGFHRRGDHWKVDCNVCRCGADGAILCSEYPCAERAVRDASRTD